VAHLPKESEANSEHDDDDDPLVEIQAARRAHVASISCLGDRRPSPLRSASCGGGGGTDDDWAILNGER